MEEEEGSSEAQKGLESLWNVQGKVGNALGALNFALEAREEQVRVCESGERWWVLAVAIGFCSIGSFAHKDEGGRQGVEAME